MNKIYLDNGATTKVDPKVVDAMKLYFLEKYGNASSFHDFGQQAKQALDSAREVIAKSINANDSEIIFTSGGSEANNLAIKGIASANREKRNHIITTKIEHPSVLEASRCLEKQGFKITYLDVDKDGFVDLNQLEKSITEKTILVSVIHGNNEIGTIQDLKKIGDICKKNNILFHTDAVQSYTKVDLDVKKLNIDLISLNSHKIHGPKGVGALFVRKGTNIEKQMNGGGQEFKKRAGTENIPGVVGFAKAVELANDKKHIANMKKLRDKLITELLKIKDTQLNGARGKDRLCNNVNISFNFIEGESLLMHLNLKGIAVSTGSACTSQSLEPSHVLIALGLKHEIAHGSIRFSLSRFNTMKEVDYTIDCVNKIVENLRSISPLVER